LPKSHSTGAVSQPELHLWMSNAFQTRMAYWSEISLTFLDQEIRRDGQSSVTEAMCYAVHGGKGFRAFLALESSTLYDVPRDIAVAPAAAIEAIHAYSLIHDDLPAMDDDDLRRGQPTVHKAWDEATAVLAGDALQAKAFEVLASHEALSPTVAVELTKRMAVAAGNGGMVGGQALDIAAEAAKVPLDITGIQELQEKKTGALIDFAASVGPVLAGQPDQAMRAYSNPLGLAFQVADDILDVEGDIAVVGKAVQKDAAANKATFVTLLGLDGAKKMAAELVDTACDALAAFDGKANHLRDAARFVVTRQS